MKMTLAKRAANFPIGRICGICGRGQTPRLGGCMGASPILRALGYDIPANTMAFAHLSCIERKRRDANRAIDCRNCGGAGYTLNAPRCPACKGTGKE